MRVIDYNGIAVLIAAVSAAVVSIGTAIMQWRTSTKMDKNKEEAIQAREQQTNTIIQSAVTPALNTPPPTPTGDPDKP